MPSTSPFCLSGLHSAFRHAWHPVIGFSQLLEGLGLRCQLLPHVRAADAPRPVVLGAAWQIHPAAVVQAHDVLPAIHTLSGQPHALPNPIKCSEGPCPLGNFVLQA